MSVAICINISFSTLRFCNTNSCINIEPIEERGEKPREKPAYLSIQDSDTNVSIYSRTNNHYKFTILMFLDFIIFILFFQTFPFVWSQLIVTTYY